MAGIIAKAQAFFLISIIIIQDRLEALTLVQRMQSTGTAYPR